jgi:transmembrane sensor
MSKTPISEITSLSDQAIDWVIKLNSGTASKQDSMLAEEWQQRSPSHRKAFTEAEQLWLEMGEVLKTSGDGQKPKLAVKPFRNINRYQAGIAASLLLAALMIPLFNFSDYWLSDFYTRVGEQKDITLADGSSIELDTDTALSVALNETGRRITLQRGRAVFSVARDPGRPFEVATDTAVVKALGTVFEVMEAKYGTRITVVEHAVSVKGLHDQDYAPSSRINSGQQASYSLKHGLKTPLTVDPKQITAWQRGKLILKNQPLASVIAELDRYYPGRMAILNGRLKAMRVTGVFPVNDPAGALNLIADILPVKITRITPWLTLLSG